MSWDALLGQSVGSGWRVVERKLPEPGDSGSNFSVGFFVERAGQRGFMKVFELDRLMTRTRGNLASMKPWIDLFEHERKLLAICQGAEHVISAIDKGSFPLPAVKPGIDFEFIIFELADSDLRRHYNYSASIDLAFALTIAKYISMGMKELHDRYISHNDTKPSNVLLIGPNGSNIKNSKIGDLGSAACSKLPIWHDAQIFCGDPAYAPPEALYQQEYPDWHDRRQAKDLWMLGSLVVFLITKVNLTTQVLLRIPASCKPGSWGDPYQNLIPVLVNAVHRVLAGETAFNTHVGKQIRSLVQELCHPDPLKRGSPRISARPHKFSMDRYISAFDRLLRFTMTVGDH